MCCVISGGLVLMVFVLLLAHLFGCVWYYVGTEDQLENVQGGIPAAAGTRLITMHD